MDRISLFCDKYDALIWTCATTTDLIGLLFGRVGEDLLVVCVMGVVHILLELFDWTASVYEGGESSVRFSWYVGQPASTWRNTRLSCGVHIVKTLT